jgi:3-isopropylmalate/(R)-2-methylmalate dehydratase small subunit
MAKVIYKLENDISTDIIYPGRYMATVLPTETPQYAFADIIELNDKLINKIPGESIAIVGGMNFGCGSSREQAVSALKGHELIVVAKSISRIFLQNGINLGLKMIICPNISADVNDELEIQQFKVINKTKNKEYDIEPLPPSKQTVIDAGGLIEYTRNRLNKSE